MWMFHPNCGTLSDYNLCYNLVPRQDWMYYMDEIETTDTGSYTPSEVETMATRWPRWFFVSLAALVLQPASLRKHVTKLY